MPKEKQCKAYNLLIYFLRSHHCYTSKAVAAYLNITERQYTNIENGYTLPAYALLEQLAVMYKVSIEFLSLSCAMVDFIQFQFMIHEEAEKPGPINKAKLDARKHAFLNPVYRKQ